MQNISLTELKKRLRYNFRDNYNIQWSDELLDDIIYEAQREYAIFSEGLVARHNVTATDSVVQSMPDDFFKVIRIIGADGREIPVVSYRKLAEDYGDFRQKKGDKAEYICFNFDGFGKFRIFPHLPENTFVGTVYYKRLPQKEDLQIQDYAAIEQHALFQMYQFTGKKQALLCYNEFLRIVNCQQKNKLNTGKKIIARSGVYY
jgi:hypothetical protein